MTCQGNFSSVFSQHNYKYMIVFVLSVFISFLCPHKNALSLGMYAVLAIYHVVVGVERVDVRSFAFALRY